MCVAFIKQLLIYFNFNFDSLQFGEKCFMKSFFFLHFLRISENFILIEPLEFYARIFDMDWMKERLLRGDCVELKYAFRFFGKRSIMTL